MRKTLWVTGIIAVVSIITFCVVNFLSSEVVTDNLTGDSLISAIQTKINYNAVASIAILIFGVSALVIAVLVFSRYIKNWTWVNRLP